MLKKRDPFYFKNKSVADLYKIFGRKHPEKTCYKSFQFCPPHLKIVTTLPCENLKSYFSSLYYYYTTMSGLRNGTNMKLSTMWHNNYSKCTYTGVESFAQVNYETSWNYETSTSAADLPRPVLACVRLIPAYHSLNVVISRILRSRPLGDYISQQWLPQRSSWTIHASVNLDCIFQNVPLIIVPPPFHCNACICEGL